MIFNMIKFVLPVVISETQSAFYPGRLITYNIMLAYEVNHYMKKEELTRKKWGCSTEDGYVKSI